MTCFVPEGDLPLKLHWEFNGTKLTEYPEVTTASVGKRTVLLSIDSVSYEHAGNYSCIAQNAAGATAVSAELQVNGYFYLLKYQTSQLGSFLVSKILK